MGKSGLVIPDEVSARHRAFRVSTSPPPQAHAAPLEELFSKHALSVDDWLESVCVLRGAAEIRRSVQLLEAKHAKRLAAWRPQTNADVLREHISREHISRDHVSRDHVSREHVSRDHVSRDHPSRDHASRDHASQDHVSRDVPRDHVPRGYTQSFRLETSEMSRVPSFESDRLSLSQSPAHPGSTPTRAPFSARETPSALLHCPRSSSRPRRPERSGDTPLRYRHRKEDTCPARSRTTPVHPSTSILSLSPEELGESLDCSAPPISPPPPATTSSSFFHEFSDRAQDMHNDVIEMKSLKVLQPPTMAPASCVLMVRPSRFHFNEETSKSNAFQNRVPDTSGAEIQAAAAREFDAFVGSLRDLGVFVEVVEDDETPVTPDSIFPNNIFSTHESGSVYIYPMEAMNRRLERGKQVLKTLRNQFEIRREIDLSWLEEKGEFLEGTGSLVLDRMNHVAYAAISTRTTAGALAAFGDMTKDDPYEIIAFNAEDAQGTPIYHTNVLLAVGEKFAIICPKVIVSEDQRRKVLDSLKASGKEVVLISEAQLGKYAANVIELQGSGGQGIIAMSNTGWESLDPAQRETLGKLGRVITPQVPTIENVGGGSVRCMVAEIFLLRLN